MSHHEDYDILLAKTCTKAFSESCNVGCLLSDAMGQPVFESGYGCCSCGICRAANRKPEDCVQAQIYGMSESTRFGGKYIYFCPMGLTCFVSPILGDKTIDAKITVGPFLMVEPEDYVSFDLKEELLLDDEAIERVKTELKNIPYIPTEKVNEMSTLLFMSVGFMNNINYANHMLERQGTVTRQGQISSYIQQIKTEGDPIPYPLETEHKLMQAVRQANMNAATKHLNDLLGHIFFSTNGDLEQIKVMIYELIAVLCRTIIDAGANQEKSLNANRQYYKDLNKINDFDELCRWITKVLNTMMNTVFDFDNARHANVIHQSIQYITENFHQKITLEDLAKRVYLSPAYFGRIFKEETGETFVSYLNHVRIDKSKELLGHNNIPITDIANMVGFDEQSYFCRVFKKTVGMTPSKYRDSTLGTAPI